MTWVREKQTAGALKNGADRISGFMTTIYDSFLSQVAGIGGTNVPTFVELALTEDFLPVAERALLKQDLPDDKDIIENAISKIPAAIAQWRETWNEFLLDIIRQSNAYSGRPITRDVLPYASTLFLCECENLLNYSNVLSHRCFRAWRVFGPAQQTGVNNRNKKQASQDPQPDDPIEISVEDMVREAFYRSGWVSWPRRRKCLSKQSGRLTFHTAGHFHMLALLDALGMERTTSIVTMTNVNPTVKCLCKCFKSSKGGLSGENTIMRWDRAVSI